MRTSLRTVSTRTGLTLLATAALVAIPASLTGCDETKEHQKTTTIEKEKTPEGTTTTTTTKEKTVEVDKKD